MWGCHFVPSQNRKKQKNKMLVDNRIERISNSIMNEWMFLNPRNRDDSFEINPMSFELVWNKLRSTPEFYFTPLGLFTVQLTLFFLYLVLFTVLSRRRTRVHDEFDTIEIIFWVCNIGFVFNECMQIVDQGLAGYFDQWVNYIDFSVSAIFVVELTLRIIAVYMEPLGPGKINLFFF